MSKIKLAIIQHKHRIYFTELDPFGMMERSEFPDRVLIGAAIKDKLSGFDIPVGLMILKVQHSAVIIEWLFVRSGFREKSVGGMLMRLAVAAAKKRHIDQLGFYSIDYDGRDELCYGEREYLEEYEFEQTKNLSGEWMEKVGGILGSGVLHKLKKYVADKNSIKMDNLGNVPALVEKHLKDIRPLDSLSASGKKNLYKKMTADDKAHMMFSAKKVLLLADEKVTMVLMNKEEPAGAIFLQKAGSAHYVTGLWGNSRFGILGLIFMACIMADKIYGSDTYIRVIKYSEEHVDLVQHIFNEKPIKSRLYCCPVDKSFYTFTFSFRAEARPNQQADQLDDTEYKEDAHDVLNEKGGAANMEYWDDMDYADVGSYYSSSYFKINQGFIIPTSIK